MPLGPWAIVAVALLATNANAEDNFIFMQADRIEYVEHEENWLWDAQGWYGNDEHKLWLKSEGALDRSSTEEAELQLLYSRPISAFWDIQLGLRHDIEPDPVGTHLVVGFQGLAPQWFEVDVAAFVHEDGDVSVRFEAEYDLLLTQRLVLQPRLEIDTGPESFALGIRLRYEIRREIAPYIGLSWQNEARRHDFVSFVAGARFWF
jgi:copper resistance protein B